MARRTGRQQPDKARAAGMDANFFVEGHWQNNSHIGCKDSYILDDDRCNARGRNHSKALRYS